MDFRTNAAEITFQRTHDSSGAALAQLDESGCLEISGGRRTHCLFEIPFLVQSLASQLAGLTFMTLIIMDVWQWRWTFGLLILLLVVGLVARKIKALLLYAYLRVRAGSLVQVLKDLPCVDVGLEKGDTYKRLKLVIEDEGLCLLDASQRRILIEGCSYRYVIYARDVTSIAPISGLAMSGARLVCQMAGNNFDVVLMARGHGPLASLVQTFSPLTGGENLASQLNQTLFGDETPAYVKPPPFPSERR